MSYVHWNTARQQYEPALPIYQNPDPNYQKIVAEANSEYTTSDVCKKIMYVSTFACFASAAFMAGCLSDDGAAPSVCNDNSITTSIVFTAVGGDAEAVGDAEGRAAGARLDEEAVGVAVV